MYKQTQWGSAVQVVLGSALISFSPFFVEFSGIDAFANGFYRMMIGGIVFLLITLFRRNKLPGINLIGTCLLAALAIGLDTALWNQSVLYIGAGLSTVLANLEVVFMVFLGIIFFKEKLHPLFIAILAIVGLGVFFLIHPFLFEEHVSSSLGISLAITASFVYSIYLLLLKMIGNKNGDDPVPTTSLLAVICLSAAFFLWVLMQFVPSSSLALKTPQSIICVVLNGLIGQVAGWLLITNGLKNVSLSLSGLLMLTQPALTFIFDCTFLGRNTQGLQLMGCAIFLIGVYITTLMEKTGEQCA